MVGERAVLTNAVRIDRSRASRLAVVRRQSRPSELSRLVPECCGLVWNAVRAQQVKAGRHVALYWDGSIRLEVGVELHEPFADRADVVCSATPAGLVATAAHFGPYQGLPRCSPRGSAVVRGEPSPTGRSQLGDYGHWQRESDAHSFTGFERTCSIC